jgi:MYXO-CTERM domain-containing protein
MKLSQITGATLLTLGLAILPATLPASAQTDTTGTTTTDTIDATGTADNTADQATDGNYADGDWGLLGLLGLFGLFGRRSHSDEPTAYQDPATTRSTTNRF